mgnify:CR=1 FL=1
MFATLEAVIRIVIFVAYIWALGRSKEIARVFQYHGAEHKSIHAFEQGRPLTAAATGATVTAAAVAALDSGHLYAYVCDFPSNLLKDHPRVITLPHIGASTAENMGRIGDVAEAIKNAEAEASAAEVEQVQIAVCLP